MNLNITFAVIVVFTRFFLPSPLPVLDDGWVVWRWRWCNDRRTPGDCRGRETFEAAWGWLPSLFSGSRSGVSILIRMGGKSESLLPRTYDSSEFRRGRWDRVPVEETGSGGPGGLGNSGMVGRLGFMQNPLTGLTIYSFGRCCASGLRLEQVE
jgi:hypothetical protein